MKRYLAIMTPAHPMDDLLLPPREMWDEVLADSTEDAATWLVTHRVTGAKEGFVWVGRSGPAYVNDSGLPFLVDRFHYFTTVRKVNKSPDT